MPDFIGQFLASPAVTATFSVLALGAGILWVLAAWWVFQDMNRRSRYEIAALGAVAWIVLSTPVLLPLSLAAYLFARPQQTVGQRRSRDLVVAMREELTDVEAECPGCAMPVELDWRRCPSCATWLQTECTACRRWSSVRLALCPWCAAERPAYAPTFEAEPAFELEDPDATDLAPGELEPAAWAASIGERLGVALRAGPTALAGPTPIEQPGAERARRPRVPARLG